MVARGIGTVLLIEAQEEHGTGGDLALPFDSVADVTSALPARQRATIMAAARASPNVEPGARSPSPRQSPPQRDPREELPPAEALADVPAGRRHPGRKGYTASTTAEPADAMGESKPSASAGRPKDDAEPPATSHEGQLSQRTAPEVRVDEFCDAPARALDKADSGAEASRGAHEPAEDSAEDSDGTDEGGDVQPRPAGTYAANRITTVVQQLSNHGHVPLVTLCSFPMGFVLRLGGIVTARAVKLLDKMDNPDETDARDAWWNELRDEISAHARALGYTAVVGYSETTSIANNLCLLTATGTAAIINTDPHLGVACIARDRSARRVRRYSRPFSASEGLYGEEVPRVDSGNQDAHGHYVSGDHYALRSGSLYRPTDLPQTPLSPLGAMQLAASDPEDTNRGVESDLPGATDTHSVSDGEDTLQDPCEVHHLPPQALGQAFAGEQLTCQVSKVVSCSVVACFLDRTYPSLVSPCTVSRALLLIPCTFCQHVQVCGREGAFVSELLITTVDPPRELLMHGQSELIQARVCRLRRKTHGSADSAAELGEGLPFLEYETYRQLISKLRIRAMNALFNLRLQASIRHFRVLLYSVRRLASPVAHTSLTLACFPDATGLHQLQPGRGRGHRNGCTLCSVGDATRALGK